MNENNQLRLVTFEQAKRLDKLGFDWKTLYFYTPDEFICCSDTMFNFNECNDNINVGSYSCSAPTVALALKWFRDTKKMYSDGGFYVVDKKWRFFYGQQKNPLEEKRTDVYDTYEEAESILLDELIEQIDNN
jgi:hypothetical protein